MSGGGRIKDGVKAKHDEQLLVFLKDQRAMQLYVGLSMLPQETAWWFFNYVVTKDNSEEVAAGIYFAAPYLHSTPEGQVYIPGQRQGELNWQRALEAKSPAQVMKELFKRKNGGALYLFAALSAAGDVGDFIARSNYLFQLYSPLKNVE